MHADLQVRSQSAGNKHSKPGHSLKCDRAQMHACGHASCHTMLQTKNFCLSRASSTTPARKHTPCKPHEATKNQGLHMRRPPNLAACQRPTPSKEVQHSYCAVIYAAQASQHHRVQGQDTWAQPTMQLADATSKVGAVQLPCNPQNTTRFKGHKSVAHPPCLPLHQIKEVPTHLLRHAAQ